MDIGKAIYTLKAGGRVTREGWNGKGQQLMLLEGDQSDDFTQDVVAIIPVDGGLVPWTASQTDLLATDWVEVR